MPSILVVHRDAGASDHIRALLEQADYHVEVSAPAVAYAYAQSLVPDLIVFILQTPADQRVLDLIHQDAHTAALPLLLSVETPHLMPTTLPPHTTTLRLPIDASALLAAVVRCLTSEPPNQH